MKNARPIRRVLFARVLFALPGAAAVALLLGSVTAPRFGPSARPLGPALTAARGPSRSSSAARRKLSPGSRFR